MAKCTRSEWTAYTAYLQLPSTYLTLIESSALIDPGKLDRRITLQSASVSTDGFGQAVRTYSTLAQVWAKVDYRGTPKEGEDTEKLTSLNKVRFTIRYRSDVDATVKISWGGKTYEIEGVSLEGRERYLIIDTVLRD